MTKKKVKEEVPEEAPAVKHDFESHLAYVQHKTQTWEALAHAIDVMNELSGDDKSSLHTLKQGRSDIAYALLVDLQELKDLYECMVWAEPEKTPEA